MWRRSVVRRLGTRQAQTRYETATFHDGAHRVAPGDATPWRESALASLLSRLRTHWLAPLSYALVLALSCGMVTLAAYCATVQQDAKAVYVMNRMLMRNLHAEQQRAEASEQRVAQLRDALASVDAHSSSSAKRSSRKGAPATPTTATVNYEVELLRERARVTAAQERARALEDELQRVRHECALVVRERDALRSAQAASIVRA